MQGYQQEQKPQVSPKYQELEKIGEGQFGTVKKIKRISDGRIMVWKQIKYGEMTSEQRKQVVQEVNILKDLSHPHIVKYYDRVIDSKGAKIYIIMEFCEGGDVGSYLNNQKKRKEFLDEDVIWKIFFQLMLALQHCHNRDKKILHRDIKPANIMIDETGSNIKLGDFGLSRELGQHSEFAKTYVGTPYYMSPEQVSNRPKYNEKSDIWSVGCIIYELAALKRPFTGLNHFQLGANIRSGKYERIPRNFSQNLMAAIARMLTINPEQRPTATQLLELPLLKVRVEDKQIRQKSYKLKQKQKELENRQKILQQKLRVLQQTKYTKYMPSPESLYSLEETPRLKSFNSVRLEI